MGLTYPNIQKLTLLRQTFIYILFKHFALRHIEHIFPLERPITRRVRILAKNAVTFVTPVSTSALNQRDSHCTDLRENLY